LSRAQILLLAVIPKAPSLYDPFGSPENQGRLRTRALSLAALVDLDVEEIEAAMGSFGKGEPEIKAPHFVRFLLQRLNGRDGVPDLSRTEIARVVSTLDLDLYRRVSASIAERLAAAAADERQRPPLQNAAALVLDNSGIEVLAWVGSRDFFDPSAAGQIDGVRVRSSSGSTLKPFLYALALERGFTASSLLPDLALTFGLEEGYRPENFDRRRRGPVRLRTALASSLNVPAVYLLSRLGMEEFLDSCDELEIALPRDAEARYGLGLAIGNAEVSLLELTRAFSVFPNHGLLRGIRLALRVDTLDGRAIPLENAAEPKRVFREQTAWLVSDILSDSAARASGFGTESRFSTVFPAMFKSGTASEYYTVR